MSDLLDALSDGEGPGASLPWPGGHGAVDAGAFLDLLDDDDDSACAPAAARPAVLRSLPAGSRRPHGGHNARSAQALARAVPMSRERRLLTQKVVRSQARLEVIDRRAKAERAAIAKVWNRTRLQSGQRLRADGALVLRRQPGRRWRHARQWTLEGTIAVGFECIGRISQRLQGSRQTRKEIDAVAATALAHQARQGDHLRVFALTVEAGANRPWWVCLERAFDCTPVHVKFGCLQSLLAPIARYWWRGDTAGAATAAGGAAQPAETGTWKLLNFEEYTQRQGRGALRAGTVEMFGQTARLTWPVVLHESPWCPTPGSAGGAAQPAGAFPFVAVRHETLRFCPSFVAHDDASTLLSTLEATLPALQLDSLAKLTKQVPLVVLALTSDLAASNTRMKHAVADFAREHNLQQEGACGSGGGGYIVILDVGCVAHIIHRIVEVTFRTNTLIPRLHATAFTVAHVPQYRHLLRTLRELVAEDLREGFHPHMQPPPESAHTKGLIEITALRAKVPTNEGPGAEQPAAADGLACEVARFFNGDWRSRRIQHYCYAAGCCQNHRRAAAVDRATALLAEFLLTPLSVGLPAENRWYTFGPTLALQAAGHLCHGVLPRLLARAFAHVGAAPPDVEGEDSFHLHMTRKTKQCLEFHTCPNSKQTLLVALLATQPVDRLSASCQHLDHHSGAAREVTSPNGSLYRCQRHLWSLLNAWERSTAQAAQVSAVRHHLGSGLQAQDALWTAVLEIGGAVWARLEVTYGNWPWLLLACADDGEHGGAGQPALGPSALQRRFFEEDACCLDAWFSEWFRKALSGPGDFRRPEVQTLLHRLARQIATTNMGLEGLLAQVKAATPKSRRGGAPLAERLGYLGLLSQLLHDHMEAGNSDPRRDAGAVAELAAHGLLDRRPVAKKCRRGDQAADPGGCGAAEPADDSGAAEPAVPGLQEWVGRSKEWPLTADCLESLLRREGVARRGIVAAMGRIRWENRHLLLAQDAGLVPKEKTYKHRRSCSAAHPGLCATKDKDLYRDALTLAKAIEGQLPVAGLHTYYLFEDARQDHPPPARPANPLVGRSLRPPTCGAASRATQPCRHVRRHH